MSKIYELTEAQTELLSRLYWLNESDEEDAEEIASIKKELTKIRGSAENTLEFLSGLLLSFNYDASVHEDEKKRLLALSEKAKKRQISAEKNAERIEGIMCYMFRKFNIEKVSSRYGDFARTITPGAVKYGETFDVNRLPEKFVKIVPEHKEPNGKELMAALRAKIEDKKLQTIVVVDELQGVSLVRKEGIKVI